MKHTFETVDDIKEGLEGIISMMEKEETILSRLKLFFFPHGRESVNCWLFAIGSLCVIGLGSFLFLNGVSFMSIPTTFSLMNSAGFFFLSLGFAMLFFSFNRHESISTRKNMELIIGKLENIEKNQR